MENTSENVFTNEEQDIIARSKAAGCYMQAPNGQPTNLNERQWVQVRTGAFKAWFGDWEKAARIKKLYNARPVEITGNEIAPGDDLKQYKKNALEYGKNLRGEYTNKDTNTPISLTGGNSRGGIREILQHDYKDKEHLQSIAAIPRIIEDSIFIDELPNEDVGKYPGIKSFSYYVCELKIGGSNYTVKAVIANQYNGIRYYDHRLSSIEKSELLSIIPTIQKAGIESNPLLSNFKDKRLFSILQTNSSKVVDENGEPLVVYHGTSLSREQEGHKTRFRIDDDWVIDVTDAPFHTFRGGAYGGLIFTSFDEGKASSIGSIRSMELPDDENGEEQWTEVSYVYDLFANARKPFDVKDGNAVREVLDELGENITAYDFYLGLELPVSREDAEKMLAGGNSWRIVETPTMQKVIRAKGYDAIRSMDEGVECLAVLAPNQLKAAGKYLYSERNTGAFSPDIDDIRFRQVYHGSPAGNVGKGKTYDPSTPPYRSQYGHNSSFRPRNYKDIPFINQFGAYVEDNFKWSISGTHDLNIQAGVRYDHTSVVGGIFSPRVNASIDLIPNLLSLQGGYGIAAKMPSLLYLYPENAYFEYININELANENIPESQRLFMTTTEVRQVDNSDLKIAQNHKAEVGFNLRVGKTNLNVIAYKERLKDGYVMSQTFNTFNTFIYNEYQRTENGIELSSSLPVLSTYAKPTNNLNIETKGLEFDLNIGRIDAIRTAFQINGSWMRTKSWRQGYSFYDNSEDAASARKPVAIYSQDGNASYKQQFVTTLRATHNIPRIGFVVTMTAQAIWQQSNWNTFGNDSIPVGYLALEDASVNMFPEGQYTTTQQVKDAGYGYMLNNVSHNNAIKESYSPYFCFNLNVTKEISDMLRVSFFANNMFRSYPRRESKRNPGSYTQLNNRFFFGLELSLTL